MQPVYAPYQPPPVSTGLPAMIPTYDDTTSPAHVKGLPYPGSIKVANEKEQALNAAQAIQSKLQEMEAAQKEEERRKKEQRMAERIAMMEATQSTEEGVKAANVSKAATGRILEQVEKHETEMKDGDKRKRKRDKDSPMLITLKPFYRPNDKNKNVKKRKLDTSEVVEESTEDEEFTPRSPVPLPDNSSLRPVLKPYMSKCLDKKAVKYADGVLPGQGSPDQSYSYASAQSSASQQEAAKPAKKKKYKKVTITVITQHAGDTDSESEMDIPPPPPGSPPR